MSLSGLLSFIAFCSSCKLLQRNKITNSIEYIDGLWLSARPIFVLFLAIVPFGSARRAWASGPVPTTVNLTMSSGGNQVTSVAAGSVITLTAVVTAGEAPLTLGQVLFCDAGAASCTDIHLRGIAQLTSAGVAKTSFVPGLGSHSYKAEFVGTASYAASVSAPALLSVTGTSSVSTAISSSGSVNNYTLTGKIVSTQASVAPTGSVSFLDTTNSGYALASVPLGTGTVATGFQSAATLPTGSSPTSIAEADFNGDGLPDLAFTVAGNQLTILLGNGDGTFKAAPIVQLPSATGDTVITAGDFNGDGVPDLAALSSSGTLTILLGVGDGSFIAKAPGVTIANTSDSIATADFNNDGIPDLAIDSYDSGFNGLLTILLGNGDGTFTRIPGTLPVSGDPLQVLIGDFNGDGKPDIACTGNGEPVTILLGNGDGTFTAAATPASPSFPGNAVLADLNGDGNLDIALTNQGTIGSLFILLGNGNGTFTHGSDFSPLGSFSRVITAGDFNGDGIVDVAVGNLGSPVYVLSGNGNGTFTSSPGITFSGISNMVAGDVNGDGLADIVATSSNAVVFLAQYSDTFTASVSGIAVVGSGTHQVEASYPGDSNFNQGVSSTIALTAQPATTSLSLSGVPSSTTFGQPVVLTASLSPFTDQGHSTDGQTVTFYNGSVNLGTGTLTSGIATLNLSSLPTGNDGLSASYTADTNFATATGTLSYTVAQITPVVTWTPPAGAVYTGQPVGSGLLTAGSTTPGIFSYTSSLNGGPTVLLTAASVLSAGTYTLKATLAPTDAVNYSTASQSVTFTVTQATPIVTWAMPAAVTYGTALSSTQLNATANVPGTFVYSPDFGTVPTQGSNTLNVTFTPTDKTDYVTVNQSVSLTVNQATPVITWATPAAITYGAALSSAQLDATSNIPGTFSYTPALGTIPVAGPISLSVTFTPTDAKDYTSATKSVNLMVNPATPTITWATPATITYGAALSSAQLDATSNVPGIFSYTPGMGTIPVAGPISLSVTFTPTDANDYTSATKSVNLMVSPATPTITWPTPAGIIYGTALSGTQLNATASVPGSFIYTPAAGSVPVAGNNSLSVTFTPTDSANYTTATTSVTLFVNQAVPTITWTVPSAVTYGTALNATQLNATASVAGTFSYTPAAGSVPTAGNDVLSVTFTPADKDYTTATKSIALVVNQATPTVSWATPEAIAYGTSLTSTQLNATASVPGTFSYTPAAGSTPAVGVDTLTVLFTPTDATDYTTAAGSASLMVTQATPTISWTTPAAITYGTALGGAQLNATASVAGTFSYSPAAGALLSPGNQTLSVTFTPTDTTRYLSSGSTVSLLVNKAPLTITANNTARVFGAANPTFTGTVSATVNGDSLVESFATQAAPASIVGSYPIVPSISGTNAGNYSVTVVNGALTVTQAGTATTFALSNQNLTLTATVASLTSGTPTGTVTFYEGQTIVGSGALSNGIASYTASSFPTGDVVVSAEYSGDVDFTQSAAPPILSLSVAPATTTLTVAQSGAVTDLLTVSVAPGYTGAVQFACTGLPQGSSCSFAPASVSFTGTNNSTSTTLTIQTGTQAHMAPPSPGSSSRLTSIAGMLWLPSLFVVLSAGRRRRLGLGFRPHALILLLSLAGLSLGLTACAGGSSPPVPPPGTSTVQVVASGPSGITQTTNLTLTVQ